MKESVRYIYIWLVIMRVTSYSLLFIHFTSLYHPLYLFNLSLSSVSLLLGYVNVFSTQFVPRLFIVSPIILFSHLLSTNVAFSLLFWTWFSSFPTYILFLFPCQPFSLSSSWFIGSWEINLFCLMVSVLYIKLYSIDENINTEWGEVRSGWGEKQ